MKHNLQTIKSQFTLLLLASILAFSSCKKDDSEPKPAQNNNNMSLAETLQSGGWRITKQELESGDKSTGFYVKMVFFDFKTLTIFKADETYTQIGENSVKMTMMMDGQILVDETDVTDASDTGTYHVKSESRLFKESGDTGGLIYDVVSFSSSKIELSFDGQVEQDGDFIQMKMTIVYEK